MKQIKFNLILDGKPVRTIEELQDNFNLDDILDYFFNGLLEKWLKVRKYDSFLAQVQKINAKIEIVEISKKLINIFNIELNDEAIFYANFLQNHKKNLENLAKTKVRTSQVITNYHKQYNKLKSEIDSNQYNLAYLKNGVSFLEKRFFELFVLEHEKLVQYYFDTNILMLIAMMFNNKLRKFVIENYTIKTRISSILAIRETMIKEIFNELKNLKDDEPHRLKKYIKTFQKNSSKEWIKLTDEDTLIIRSNAGVKLREPNNPESELGYVYAKSSVLKGLEFQSFKNNHFVQYILLKDIEGFISAIKIFRGETEGYWKDLEPKNKKCMILHIDESSYVRSLGKHGEELSAKDVNGEFLILDGLDYKSNSASHEIYYITD